MRLKPLDFVIAFAAAAAIAFASSYAYGPGGGEPSVVVKGRDGEWMYPLSVDRTVEVAGPLGETVVEIRGKAVHITDSPCRNKTCIAAGFVSKPGQWIACLPNRVFVRVEGGATNAGVDAYVY